MSTKDAATGGTGPAGTGSAPAVDETDLRAEAAQDGIGATAATGRARFPDIAQLGYEQARDQLVEIVSRLEGGRLGLEESLTLWQRGEALAEHCASWLQRAEQSLSAARPGTDHDG